MVVKGNLTNGQHHVLQRPWTPTKRRGPIAAEHITPGPASFSLPSTIGSNCHDTASSRAKSPAFSFGSKHEDKRGPAIPGPGSYNISGLCHLGKETAMAPFLSGRTKEPAPFKTPAPGAYSPEKSGDYMHGGAPKYTFGLKGKDAKHDIVPAPNCYKIPGSVGTSRDSIHKQSPAYSMGIKGEDMWGGMGKHSPGPGKYNSTEADIYKSKSPSYTLSSRTNIPTDRTQKPGPGAHSPEKVHLVRSSGPSFSFGIRHSPYIINRYES